MTMPARFLAPMAALIVVGATRAQAQPVTEAWIRTAAFPPYTYGAMLALDSHDNVISVGYSPGASDLATTKYNSQGNELWQRHYSMTSYSLVATWVSVDPSDNIVVTGYPQSFSSNPVQAGLLTLKYDADGQFLWSDFFPATWGISTRSIMDPSGNIYVTGRGWFGTDDFVTIKYAPDGTRLWLDVFDQGGGFHTPTAMDLDEAGHLLVTGAGRSGGLITALYDASGVRQWVVQRPGRAGASVRFTGDGHFYLTGALYSPATGDDFMVQKYDLGGHLTWERLYNFGGTELGLKLALDSLGNVYVTGIQGVYSNWLTMKIDPQGAPLWSRVLDSHRYNDETPKFMVVGPREELYITGIGGPAPPGPNVSDQSMVTVRYDSDGSLAWSQTHSTWASRGVGAALGRDNALYVIGLGNATTTIKYTQPASNASGVTPIPDASMGLALLAPSSNPFTSAIELGYSLSAPGDVDFGVFDVSGRLVARLAAGARPAGVHRVAWDGRDDRGVTAPAGAYLLQVRAGSCAAAGKILKTR